MAAPGIDCGTIMKKNASEQVAEQLERMIASQQLNPGMKLPSERILSEQFGVGRYTVREGLAILQTRGMIKVYPGKGAFVCDKAGNVMREVISSLFTKEEQSLENVLETRCYIESISAQLAAKRCTDKEIAELEKQLERIKNATEITLNPTDEQFHYLIAKATHNSSFSEVVKKVIQASKVQIKKNMFDYSKALNLMEDGVSSVYTEKFKQENYLYHKKIFEAIKAHDETTAYNAMFDHLKNGILIRHMEKKIRNLQEGLFDEGNAK